MSLRRNRTFGISLQDSTPSERNLAHGQLKHQVISILYRIYTNITYIDKRFVEILHRYGAKPDLKQR